MENASKALIIAASVLIAVMLMTFMIFTFRRFASTARTTERRYSAQEIEAFNAKFLGYETGGTHTASDTTSIIFYRGRGGAADSTKDDISYNEIFNKNGKVASGGDKYHKALIAAASLNTIYDVVTAINDAIDINDANNNSYKYDYLEIESSVEIIVDLGSSTRTDFDFNGTPHYQYLVIEPNKDVKAKHIYATDHISTSKQTNATGFSTANPVSVYDMLKELRNTGIITMDNKVYTLYQYYFFGEVIENENTGLVETVKFTLVKDNKFQKWDE